MATKYEVRDWLGPAAATDEQVAALVALFTAVEQRWPDPDDVDERDAALTGAAQVILGDDTLEAIAQRYHRARAEERRAMQELTGALLASPGTERELGQRANVARMTVRKALGKS